MKRLIAILFCCGAISASAGFFFLVSPRASVEAGPTLIPKSYLVWEMDETNNPTADSSVFGEREGFLGGSNKTASAIPNWMAPTGTVSAYYDFDGNSDYVDYTNRAFFNGWTSFTTYVWVKRDDAGTVHPWHCTENTGFSGFKVEDDRIRCDLRLADGTVLSHNSAVASIPIDNNNWHLIGVTWQSGEAMKVWYDLREFNDTVTGTGILTNGNTRSFRLGIPQSLASPAGGGMHKPVIISNRLTVAEYTSNFWNMATNHGWNPYDAERSGTDPNQNYKGGVFTFEHNSPNPADTGPFGNFGTNAAGGASPVWVSEGEAGADSLNYMSFDGGDRIAINGVNTTTKSNRRGTWMGWMNPDVTNTWMAAMAMGDNSSATVYQRIYLKNNGNVYFALYFGTHRYVMESAKPITAGEWAHVAWTQSGTNSPLAPRMYINGSAIACSTNVNVDGWAWLNAIPVDNATIGVSYAGGSYGNYWQGGLDDIRFLTNAWRQADITNYFDSVKGIYGY